MIIVRNKLIPFGRFGAMTVYCFLFVKQGKWIDQRLMTHERIHMRQQFELLTLSAVFMFLMIYIARQVWYASWWWMIVCLVIPFVAYGASMPYDTSSFEREAYQNEHDEKYARHWWKHLFAWVWY